MANDARKIEKNQLDELYEESGHWHVNTGDQTIHAKRIPGKYRRIKWFTASVWLVFIFGPYLRWGDRQAVLWNIPDRQFHIFNITILPQDVWMLALVLLFFAILLAVVTSIAGRVFCGYFCFQTIWTDIFTLIETKLEGSPAQRLRLDNAPWSLTKFRIKLIKHTLWLLIGLITGVSFCAWFTDAYQLWHDLLTFNSSSVIWISVVVFTAGTYLFAGFMREQVCFWLCPYARIQGVMYDRETILPTYNFKRGEPRGKIKKGDNVGQGDCIDCRLCVGVCPTGIDIRHGQQEGCITCALCLDACDSIMDKINRPRGLISYASLDQLEGKSTVTLFKRPRIIIYTFIMLFSLVGIVYGLTHLGAIELKVLHERQPLFVLRSDGSIQNKYELKILNKLDHETKFAISVTGPEGLTVVGVDEVISVDAHKLAAHTVYLRLAKDKIDQETSPVVFRLQSVSDEKVNTEYTSMFIGPAH